jgi:hypothetical protein
MDLQRSGPELAELIARFLRLELRFDDGVFTYDYQGATVARLELARIEGIVQRLSSMHTSDETAIVAPTSYEIMVREESSAPGPGMWLRRTSEPICKRDNERSLDYRLGRPSEEYTLFVLDSLVPLDTDSKAWTVLARNVRFLLDHRSEEAQEDVLDLVARALRVMTLKVTADEPMRQSEFEHSATGFYFQLSFNLDVAVVPQRYFDDLTRSARIARVRRSSIEDLEPPRRRYHTDLVYHYQLGVASDSPALAYLSYYHIAEHFFVEVFDDDLISRVRDRLTRPDFSTRRRKDLGELIRLVVRAQQARGDELVFSEETALRLTLERFGDIDELIERLNAYDESLVRYYETCPVDFADAPKVDFQAGVATISKRIYQTRNAIVHSKEGPKSKYRPFVHDKELRKEIPLLRFVAEQVVVNSGKDG